MIIRLFLFIFVIIFVIIMGFVMILGLWDHKVFYYIMKFEQWKNRKHLEMVKKLKEEMK